MKKLLFMLLCAIALIACEKEEPIVTKTVTTNTVTTNTVVTIPRYTGKYVFKNYISYNGYVHNMLDTITVSKDSISYYMIGITHDNDILIPIEIGYGSDVRFTHFEGHYFSSKPNFISWGVSVVTDSTLEVQPFYIREDSVFTSLNAYYRILFRKI